MKKKIQFKPLRRSLDSLKKWPIADVIIPQELKKKLIAEAFMKDSKIMRRGDLVARSFFENQAPRDYKDLRKRFQIQVSTPPSMNVFDFAESLGERYGDINIGPKGLDRYLDIKKLAKVLRESGVDLEKKKITLFHLVKLAIHFDLLEPNKFQFLIDYYKDKFPFWQGIHLAYEAKGLTAFKPPLRILKPQKKDDLEDLLNQEPNLKLKKRGSSYRPEIIDEYPGLQQRYIEKGQQRKKLLDVLIKYPGTYLENREAWDLYQKIMGDQGPLDTVRNPGFIHFLVSFTERINQREKYILASDFLKFYLGIENLNPNSIKAHLKLRPS